MMDGPNHGLNRTQAIVWWLACVTVLLGIAPPVTATRDWNRVDDPMQGAIGAHVGKIGGVGLAYKYPPVWWLNLQVAGAIWHTQDDKRHNLGFMLQYILRQDDRLRIYTGGGAAYFYHKERNGENPDGSDAWTTATHWNGGFGVGVEWLQGGRLSFQLDGNFTYEGDKEQIIFLPQAGVFYYF